MFYSMTRRMYCAGLLAMLPLCAAAQTMEDGFAPQFEIPFGLREPGDVDAMVATTRDAALNKVVTASPRWTLSTTAIGNLVNVVTQGSNNTVMVNASQINRGVQQAVTALPRSPMAGASDAASVEGSSGGVPAAAVQASAR